ncbi:MULTISPECIES: hypothetical protein [Pantoea]|uniref:hypothetical protein n=1 Tax=Pantoea TaxID=53335 RepID=UPI000A66FCAF|nr:MULTISPECIES: hypothetical protein [Pantoea]
MPATLPGLWSKPASIAEKASITRWPGGEKPAIKTRVICCSRQLLLNMSVDLQKKVPV